MTSGPEAVMFLVTPGPAAGQETLANARQLYASADYKGALTMLNTLLAASPSPQDRQSIELYRTWTLPVRSASRRNGWMRRTGPWNWHERS